MSYQFLSGQLLMINHNPYTVTAQAITWPSPFFPQSHGGEMLIRSTGSLAATQLFLRTTVTSRRKADMQYTLRASITQTQVSQVSALSQRGSKYHKSTFSKLPGYLIVMAGEKVVVWSHYFPELLHW